MKHVAGIWTLCLTNYNKGCAYVSDFGCLDGKFWLCLHWGLLLLVWYIFHLAISGQKTVKWISGGWNEIGCDHIGWRLPCLRGNQGWTSLWFGYQFMGRDSCLTAAKVIRCISQGKWKCWTVIIGELFTLLWAASTVLLSSKAASTSLLSFSCLWLRLQVTSGSHCWHKCFSICQMKELLTSANCYLKLSVFWCCKQWMKPINPYKFPCYQHMNVLIAVWRHKTHAALAVV